MAPPSAPPAAPFPPYAGIPPYAYAPPSWGEAERHRQIGRTKTGVLLLLVGALISWIPIISIVGAICTLIGAILVILGRKAFGAAHRRNVLISIIVFFVGIGTSFVGGVIAGVAAVQASSAATEAEIAAALQNAFTNILVVLVIGSFITGLASVFFTYALQKNEGRIVLWAAYGAGVGIQVAILVVTIPLIPGIAAAMAHDIVTTGRIDPTAIANAVSGATAGLEYLGVIPNLLYATANYLAWSRINKGEIPAPPTAPTPPYAAPSPPAPPINPM